MLPVRDKRIDACVLPLGLLSGPLLESISGAAMHSLTEPVVNVQVHYAVCVTVSTRSGIDAERI